MGGVYQYSSLAEEGFSAKQDWIVFTSSLIAAQINFQYSRLSSVLMHHLGWRMASIFSILSCLLFNSGPTIFLLLGGKTVNPNLTHYAFN